MANLTVPWTIKDLHADTPLRETIFPVTKHSIFMAHAGVAPIPACAAEAIREMAEIASTGDQEGQRLWSILGLARKNAAKLLNALPEEIALLGPTSLGLNLVANGLDWNAGDEVICYRDDYPANVYPWKGLERLGVKVSAITTAAHGQIRISDLEKHITGKTRLVALTSVNNLSGFQIDIDAIGKYLHSRGILFCVDAIQSIGMAPTSVEHVDFLAADSHKWMLGPLAAGIVYIRKEHFEKVRPTLVGAWNVQSPNFIAQDSIAFEESARRYEPGAMNLIGIAGMNASMELLNTIGITAIHQSVLETRDYLANHLHGLGFTFLDGAANPGERSAIVTVLHPTADLKKISEHLIAKNIHVSLRHLRDQRPIIRFSPHFYISKSDIDFVVQELKHAIES